jgi:carotenoid cleavage dioxygenase
VKDEKIDDAPGEFGRIDERYMGQDYTYTWSLGSIGIPGMDGSPDGFNSIFRYDRKSGSRVAHTLPEGDSFGEPVFVPRSADAAEGEGFVLTVAHRPAENRSDLVILDAQNIEGAPLAVCKLPHRVPYCFHGSWMPAV